LQFSCLWPFPGASAGKILACFRGGGIQLSSVGLAPRSSHKKPCTALGVQVRPTPPAPATAREGLGQAPPPHPPFLIRRPTPQHVPQLPLHTQASRERWPLEPLELDVGCACSSQAMTLIVTARHDVDCHPSGCASWKTVFEARAQSVHNKSTHSNNNPKQSSE
jgi:hypothetical protein